MYAFLHVKKNEGTIEEKYLFNNNNNEEELAWWNKSTESSKISSSQCPYAVCSLRASEYHHDLRAQLKCPRCKLCKMHGKFLFPTSEYTGTGDCIQSYTSETISWSSFVDFPPFRVNINPSIRRNHTPIFHRTTRQLQRPRAHTHREASRAYRPGAQWIPVGHITCTSFLLPLICLPFTQNLVAANVMELLHAKVSRRYMYFQSNLINAKKS